MTDFVDMLKEQLIAANQIHAMSYEQGHQAGYQKGYMQGVMDATAQAKKLLDDAIAANKKVTP